MAYLSVMAYMYCHIVPLHDHVGGPWHGPCPLKPDPDPSGRARPRTTVLMIFTCPFCHGEQSLHCVLSRAWGTCPCGMTAVHLDMDRGKLVVDVGSSGFVHVRARAVPGSVKVSVISRDPSFWTSFEDLATSGFVRAGFVDADVDQSRVPAIWDWMVRAQATHEVMSS